MELAHPGLVFFDPESERRRETRVTAETRVEEDDERLVCARCGHTITHRAARIAVSGEHLHTCRNPHGFEFCIGCFRAAPGCKSESWATAEHSWFKGYRWSIASCAQCDRHIGWRFSAPGDAFFGLILDRLAQSPPPPAGSPT